MKTETAIAAGFCATLAAGVAGLVFAVVGTSPPAHPAPTPKPAACSATEQEITGKTTDPNTFEGGENRQMVFLYKADLGC